MNAVEALEIARKRWPDVGQLAIRTWYHEAGGVFWQLVTAVPATVDPTGWQTLLQDRTWEGLRNTIDYMSQVPR